MSIIDSLVEFSSTQLVKYSVAANVVSQNIVDLGASGSDKWGTGDTTYPGWWRPNNYRLNVVSTVPSSLTTHTMHIDLMGGDTSTAATPTGGTLLLRSNTISAAEMAGGGVTLWKTMLPRTNQRFVWLRYTCTAVHPETSMTIEAWAGLDSEVRHSN